MISTRDRIVANTSLSRRRYQSGTPTATAFKGAAVSDYIEKLKEPESDLSVDCFVLLGGFLYNLVWGTFAGMVLPCCPRSGVKTVHCTSGRARSQKDELIGMQSEEQIARLALVRNILNIFCVLSGQLKIYQQGNQAVRLTLSRLMLQLEKYFAGAEQLDLIVARHGFICDDLFVDRANAMFEKFANLIFMHGVATIKLHSGVSEYEIITFLRLLGRNPAESWDEGGVRGCLEVRRIDNIEVVELAEKDFLLLDTATGAAVSAGGTEPAEASDLWDRFALGIFHRQHGNNAATAPAELGPAELARASSAILAEQGSEEQLRFMGEVTNFLVSLQHENIRIYRAKALEKLTSYINHLSPELKRLFLQNVFNYHLKVDFAEEFFSALSDDLIMEALENAAREKSYIPPVVLKLLGKLARNRELLPAASPLLPGAGTGMLEQQTRELFRADDFEKYVPENYRHALLQILRSEEIDSGRKEELSRLKTTLQEERLEEHTGRIIVHILGHDADERHLGGLFDHLEKILELYADSGDYLAIGEIRELCAGQGATAEEALLRLLAAPAFMERLLDGAHRFGKEKHESLSRLIKTVGPPFVDPILDRLAGENNRAIRYFYIECLKGLGAAVAERASQRLGDPRWYYLRNLLALLRELGDSSLAGVIRPFFRHPHPKVRQEALKAGLSFHDGQAQRILLEQLDSSNAGDVAAAVALTRLGHDPRIIAKLSDLLEMNALFDYHLELKKGVVTALIDIDPRQALPVLERLLAGHNLLHPLRHAQLRRDIVKKLEGCEPPLVTELLQQLAASRDAELARIAVEVLSRMPGGKS